MTNHTINVPSKLRVCARARLFELAGTEFFSLRTITYVKHRSRMLLLTRQANARTAKKTRGNIAIIFQETGVVTGQSAIIRSRSIKVM